MDRGVCVYGSISYEFLCEGTCPAAACSDACDAARVTADDTYACHADGAAESDNTNCDAAGLTAPTSATVCCAVAADTCVADPPSPPPQQETETEDDKLVLILVLFGVGAVIVALIVWWRCSTKGGKTKEQLEAELAETRRKQDEMAAATGP